MKMTVVGGGNIGTLMAAEMAAGGHDVTVVTSKPSKWSKYIRVFRADNEEIIGGSICCATEDLKAAVKEADIVWATYPAFMLRDLAKRLEELPMRKGQMIGIIPGGGGVEEIFKSLTEKGIILFGFQRVHSIARIKEYGNSVYMLGRKKQLYLAAIPSVMTDGICRICGEIFQMECIGLPNYLTITLTPSNSILHTARLYSMFKDWKPEMEYKRRFLFYEEWDDDASEWLFRCDTELQNLCASIPEDLSGVVSLREHYESDTIEKMTKKIRSIPAFKGIESPMVKRGGGWIPDLESRYFKEDFPYGLKIIIDNAEKYGVEVPNMLKIWSWYDMLKDF